MASHGRRGLAGLVLGSEKHKVLTYPRTDSRALPEDYLATVKSTMESLRQSNQAIDGLHQSATGLREGVSRFKLAG